MLDSLRSNFCESNDLGFFLSIILMLILGVLLATATGMFRDSFKTYDEGQLDALNGKAKFYLKELPSGARMWVEREKGMVLPEPYSQVSMLMVVSFLV